MSFSKRGRALGLALVVIVASLVFSANALAAKPKGVQIERLETGVNYVKAKGTANPNGQSTTLTFEKYNESAGKWEGLSTSTIGSGTVAVSKEYTYIGLASGAEYYFRVSATNASGTASSGEVSYYPQWWAIEGYTGRHEATTGAEGTLRMEWENKPFSASESLICGETDSGTINTLGGNSRKVRAYNCKYYLNGKLECTTTQEPAFTINTKWETNLTLLYRICGPFENTAPVTLKEPFRVSTSGSGTNNPVTMTANMNFLGSSSYPGVITIESKWSLTGENAGKKFSFASE